jgi:hypothetical protein
MKKVLALVTALTLALSLSGCLALPTHDIMFVAGTGIENGDMVVTVNVTFTAGSKNEKTEYPHVWTATRKFEHHQIAQQGTVAGTSIRVAPTVKGQTVSCGILIDGKPLLASTNSAKYPKDAVCIGPPV